MEWTSLLSTQKLAEEEPEPEQFAQYPINEFEKDYSKIVSSPAFRRLQDKTQVFPLDKSDFVRTRLTHSIEVSTIARQLGIMISKNTSKYRPEDIGEQEAEGIASVLLCAGLLHDLGNPPFGHFGETTIGAWFKDHLDVLFFQGRPLRRILTQQMCSDLENFEGNAQALRILAKARYRHGVNLSAGVISTLVKYPTDSLSFRKDDPDAKKHKLGYFYAEQDALCQISKAVGTLRPDGTICRHPLTYMLEAADDIAYATADLEDALKKKLFHLDEFIRFFESRYDRAEAQKHGTPEDYSQRLMEDLKARRAEAAGDGQAFQDWIVYVRRWLMYVAVYRFSLKYQEIMDGTYTGDLFQETNHVKTIGILKAAAVTFAFNTPAILKLELASQTILSFLLDKFVHAALYYDCPPGGGGMTKADQKCLGIFSEDFKEDYQRAKTGDAAMDLYLRLLMATDYISGMTDTYARTLYRELSGIE